MAEAHLSPMTAAIRAHTEAYQASLTALDHFLELRRTFDPDLVHEDESAIGRAITERYGYRFRAVAEDLTAREAAANATAEAEDATWLTFRALMPATATKLREWVAYTIQHSARWTRSRTYASPWSM